MNSKHDCDLRVLPGKRKYRCVFDIMKHAKLHSDEYKFSDNLLKHLSSKNNECLLQDLVCKNM